MYSNNKMHEVINIQDEKLVTINKKLANSKRTKKLINTPEYNIFKTMLFYSIKKPKVKIEKPYAIHIFMETYIDIDNPIKAILDSLEGTIIENDRHVEKLYLDKIPRKKGHKSSLIVFVGSLNDYEFPLKGE